MFGSMDASEINPTRRAILDRMKTRGPQTAAQLAEHLSITPMGVRQHLSILQRQNLVTFEDRKGSIGRPSRHWSLRAEADRLYPDRHGELLVSLLGALQRTEGPAGMDRLLQQRNAQLVDQYRQAVGAGSLAERVAALAEVRTREGYMAEWWVEGEVVFRAENHCPICEAARACQGLCRAEWTLFEAVLGEDVRVERTEHLLDAGRRCVYRVQAD